MDLFAGCGGLTLGAAQAASDAGLALDVRLAVDFEQAAVDVYQANFPGANAVMASVEDYFDGELTDELTEAELKTRKRIGTTHLLFGGPPCQGHSDLNNRTRRDDPKNKLYLKMARAALVLEPSIVLIENVPTVRLDTAGVVQTTFDFLEKLGYDVATTTVGMHALGVAQKRRRHVLLASKVEGIDPKLVLSDLASRAEDSSFNLEWAIGDLKELTNPTGYDTPPKASAANIERMEYMQESGDLDLPNERRPKCHQDGNHSYKSMYGRLSWNDPAQTVTSGFGSIGQGRYMHPSALRALTAHEAARIQGFPDYFSFSVAMKRADLATMIGNAVPPALMREVGAAVIDLLALKPGTIDQLRLEPSMTGGELALAV
ncbi:DNA cytosine methyltransferase [Microbacterium sp. ASV49]|uniref:DNA (cytosine-5-)-methyltransferase n=1 Tax=Microbacterium candidum TaxID=3041922 RepID=A0ABT7N396_9MICO|nr:DNA cytosine methyltransferase [Microbacterium sp. ASV49]MDL9981192.1 DNA cytosine methyltransferase [Microbacterium sp. ASV49]